LVCTTKFYPGLGADTVMELHSINLVKVASFDRPQKLSLGKSECGVICSS